MSIVWATGLTLLFLSFLPALKLSLLVAYSLEGIFIVIGLSDLGHSDNTLRLTKSTVPVEFLFFSYEPALTNIPWLTSCLLHLTARSKNRRKEIKTWLL